MNGFRNNCPQMSRKRYFRVNPTCKIADTENKEFTFNNALEIPEFKTAWTELENFELRNHGVPKRCMVYFSSNGLFFPNTSEEFVRTINIENRYEWKSVAPKVDTRNIFVRDISKQWYLQGISSCLSSIELLAHKLSQLSGGLPIACVGSSAGGYAAALFAGLLNAERAYVFSAQFELLSLLESMYAAESNPVVHQSARDSRKYHLDLRGQIASARTQFCYFYPAWSDIDIAQAQFIAETPNVINVGIASSAHGASLTYESYAALFSLSDKQLRDLEVSLGSKILTTYAISRALLGSFLAAYFYCKQTIRKRLLNAKAFSRNLITRRVPSRSC